MSRHNSVPRILACSAIIAVLAACNEKSPEVADFSPQEHQVPVAVSPGGRAPSELSQAERSKPLSASSECNLERLNGQRFAGEPMQASAAGTINLSGWVVDSAAHKVPQSLELRMVEVNSNRAWKVEGQAGQARDDVQALLGGDEVYANAGYSIPVDASQLPRGSYRMYVVFEGQSGLVSCDNGRSMVVGE